MIPKVLEIIHPEGWKFISIFAAITILLALISPNLGWLGLIFTVWCAYFFRNPARMVPQRQGLVVSPADGIVSLIVQIAPPAELEMGTELCTRISVFLNVFDVHVNRVPIAGEILKIVYHPGQFLNASLDKASEKNERNTVVVETNDGTKIAFVQIAGLIARRIVCNLIEGQKVTTGEVYGLIRFGSRMDIYLPPKAEPLVIVGQRMIGGETVLVDLANPETARVGQKI